MRAQQLLQARSAPARRSRVSQQTCEDKRCLSLRVTTVTEPQPALAAFPRRTRGTWYTVKGGPVGAGEYYGELTLFENAPKWLMITTVK